MGYWPSLKSVVRLQFPNERTGQTSRNVEAKSARLDTAVIGRKVNKTNLSPSRKGRRLLTLFATSMLLATSRSPHIEMLVGRSKIQEKTDFHSLFSTIF